MQKHTSEDILRSLRGKEKNLLRCTIRSEERNWYLLSGSYMVVTISHSSILFNPQNNP